MFGDTKVFLYVGCNMKQKKMRKVKRMEGYNKVIYCRACKARFVVSNKEFKSNYCKACQSRYKKEMSKKKDK